MDRKDAGRKPLGRKAEPERLSSLLNLYIKGDSGIQKRMGEIFRLKRLWVKLMGAHISTISSPYRIKDGVLFVSVYDPMWIAELPYIKSDMLLKLNAEGLQLNDIRFTLSKIYSKITQEAPKAGHKASKANRRWAERLSTMIDDEDIRKSYLNALIAHLERHRL